MTTDSLSLAQLAHCIFKCADVPMAFIMLGIGIVLCFITKFPQVRNFRNFIRFLQSDKTHGKQKNTMSPTEALFTAMSTSLGMGCIAVPPLAVAVGGPGALFWLVVYSFFGSVTKFTEVVLSLQFKKSIKSWICFRWTSWLLRKSSSFLGIFLLFLHPVFICRMVKSPSKDNG